MTTKQRILDTSLKLFNEQGIDAITVRHIAKELGISHGNLCYHFQNTDVIIEKLYEQLLEELNELLSNSALLQQVSIKLFHDLSEFVFNKLYKYKFLMQDFVSIMRRNPNLKLKHRALVKNRKLLFQMGIGAGIQIGFLKKDIVEGQYENYFEQLFIISDFWLSSAEILYEGTEDNKLKKYINLAFTLIVPYLTEQGLEEYQAFLKH